MYFVDFFFLVGPLYVDQTVPKEKDLERELSSEFDGWVNKGGCWRPTECQARVKVRLSATFKIIFSIKTFYNSASFSNRVGRGVILKRLGACFPVKPQYPDANSPD